MTFEQAKQCAAGIGRITDESFDLGDAWAFVQQAPPDEPPTACIVVNKQTGEVQGFTEYLLAHSGEAQ